MMSKVVTDTDHDAPFQSRTPNPKIWKQCQSTATPIGRCIKGA